MPTVSHHFLSHVLTVYLHCQIKMTSVSSSTPACKHPLLVWLWGLSWSLVLRKEVLHFKIACKKYDQRFLCLNMNRCWLFSTELFKTNSHISFFFFPGRYNGRIIIQADVEEGLSIFQSFDWVWQAFISSCPFNLKTKPFTFMPDCFAGDHGDHGHVKVVKPNDWIHSFM